VDETEKENINQAAESCRKVLNHVNEEVKLMENLLVRTFSTSSLKKNKTGSTKGDDTQGNFLSNVAGQSC